MRIAAATERREALLKEVAAAQAERHTAAAAVEAALEAVDSLRAQAEASVQATAEWRAAKTARDAVEAVAAEAEKKADASEAELGAKQKPYDDDPLFAYLWRRRFGTREYAGTGFAKTIDRMVAEFVGFTDARPNYAALIEIPLRLREHATAKRAALEQPQGVALRDRAARHAGGRRGGQGEGAGRGAPQAWPCWTTRSRRSTACCARWIESRAALVAGDTNPAYNEALSHHRRGRQQGRPAHAVHGGAAHADDGADEAVVRRLETIDATIGKTDGEIASLRAATVELSRRRAEVEQVRDRFRRTGYDHPQTTFENEGAISDTLGNILEGVVRSGVLWELLRQGYKSRPTRGSPDFGGASFPFPFPLPDGSSGRGGSQGDDWREPSSRGSWSPGRGSRSDDDDFTTGGSF